MSTNRQKRIIHTIALRELGMTKTQYRTALYGAFGVASSVDLTEHQASAFIDILNEMKEKPNGYSLEEKLNDPRAHDWGWGKEKYEELAGRPAEWARPRQLRKIEAMWRDVARDPRDKALWMFLERQASVDHPVRLTSGGAEAVLTALKEMKKARAEGGSTGAQKGDEEASKHAQKNTSDAARELPYSREGAAPRPPKGFADKTQCEKILWHLRYVGSLTPLEAQQQYGIMRLAARVYDLRKNGHKIEKVDRTVPDRWGGTATVAAYELSEER